METNLACVRQNERLAHTLCGDCGFGAGSAHQVGEAVAAFGCSRPLRA
ncbi:hypothetical protein RKD20_009526 [Streptomyces sp. SLBN-8D4]